MPVLIILCSTGDGNYAKILSIAESIQFLKKNVKPNIDTNRISVMGNSAVLSLPYLGHAKKLGIKSIFPIQQLREHSTYTFFQKGWPRCYGLQSIGKEVNSSS